MKFFTRILYIAGLALGFSACNDILVPETGDVGEVPVKVSFSMADRAVLTKGMVSGTEEAVHTMQLVCFDASGQYLGIRNADVVSKGSAANGDTAPAGTLGAFTDHGTIVGTVPQGTARIHFVANRNLTIPLSHNNGTSEAVVMNSSELATAYDVKTIGEGSSAHQEIVYWGYHKADDAKAMETWLNPKTAGSSIVYMIRDRARVMLSYTPKKTGDQVEKIEWLIHAGRDRGYIAPIKDEWETYHGVSTVSGHETERISKLTNRHEYTGSGRYSLWTSEADENRTFDHAYPVTSTTPLQPQYLFDDVNEGSDLKVIMKVYYTGVTKPVFYALRLKKNDIEATPGQDGQPGQEAQIGERYPIIRNNTYYVNVSSLDPSITGYPTLKEAIEGGDFMNAEVEISRSIAEVSSDKFDRTLQILLPTETTSIVLNTAGENRDMHFAFRKASAVNEEGSTSITDFDVYWENKQTFCDPTLGLEYDTNTKQFIITAKVLDPDENDGKGISEQLQSEWIVVKHKASGLTRYIHVFVIDQFRYMLYPKLTRVGTGTYDDCLLTFQIPPMEHSRFIPDPDNPDATIPDPSELVYPQELYPIEIKFTTNTLNAYGTAQGETNYGLFGVSVESTSGLVSAENFEQNYDSPVSSTNYNTDRTHWYFQQGGNFWDFWYTYSLKEYPEGGHVNIYFKDVRQNIRYATVADVGLFLYVEYFGKNYSVPLSTN